LVKITPAASRHFTLTTQRTIDSVALPAGSEVTLDDGGRLDSVVLPAGVTLALDGAVWSGFLRFSGDPERAIGAPTHIRMGQPAAEAAFDGVSCRAG
jgi:hypothetical protein